MRNFTEIQVGMIVADAIATTKEVMLRQDLCRVNGEIAALKKKLAVIDERTCKTCAHSCWAHDPVVPNATGCSLLTPGDDEVDPLHTCDRWEAI
jgi:hypothetical protein